MREDLPAIDGLKILEIGEADKVVHPCGPGQAGGVVPGAHDEAGEEHGQIMILQCFAEYGEVSAYPPEDPLALIAGLVQ